MSSVARSSGSQSSDGSSPPQPSLSSDGLRNVALVGHTGTGKTSLVEAMLYRAGLLNRLGRVDDGSTVGDSDPAERERRHSLALNVVSLDWKGHRINLIDTPGHPDFRGEALLGLYAAELAVFVVDGVSGVQSQDQVLWRLAERLKMPRMIFVNKLDRAHSSFERTLAQVRTVFGSHADPVELPIGQESSFHGVTDLLTDEAFVYDTGRPEGVSMPDDLAEVERTEHEHLVEDVVEGDEEVLERYLEGTDPTPAELERLLHDALDAATVFPVLCGSAAAPIGADHLLDMICRVGPAPGDRQLPLAEAGGELVPIAPDPAGPPLAVAFKTRVDEFLGQVSLLKVLSGTITADQELVNTRTHRTERLHNLLTLVPGKGDHGAKRVVAGDIVAVAKLDDTRTGDTLAPVGTPVTVPLPELPVPVYGLAIRVRTPSHEDRLAAALRRLVIQDPTLAVAHDPATRQTVLTGAGETHLAVAISRVERAGVPLDVEPTRVAYRETLAGPVEVEGRYKKQTGGHGQFGVASVRFEPMDRGAGFEFGSEVVGGAIPKALIPAVGAGIEEGMARGGRYGFPVVDLRAVCTDGKHHPVDSSEMSFKMAGALALRTALDTVGSVLLEPVSELRVEVPSRFQGDVLGDLSSRRGHVVGTDAADGSAESAAEGGVIIRALVPSAEIRQYAIDLRSLTGGTGAFEVAHHGYQALPEVLVDQVVAAAASPA